MRGRKPKIALLTKDGRAKVMPKAEKVILREMEPINVDKKSELVLQKLEHAFSLGGTDAEACVYASISPRSLYYFQVKCPEFLQRKMMFKARPVLKARQAIVNAISTDTKAAWRYLKAKRPDEFGNGRRK